MPIKALRPRVRTKADAAADPSIKEDGYFQKIVKYIPVEVVTAYVAMAGALVTPNATPHPEEAPTPVLWYIYAFLLVLTPLYTWFFTLETGKPKPIFQTTISPFAFTAWVVALEGGPFDAWKASLGQPAIGSIILTSTVLLIPLIERIFARS